MKQTNLFLHILQPIIDAILLLSVLIIAARATVY
jgi:hypothetical protein